MKNLILIGIIALTIMSCKKENNTTPQNSNNNTNNNPTPTILASWKYTDLYYSNDNGATWTQDAGPGKGAIITFSSTNTYSCPTGNFTNLGSPSFSSADNGTYTNTDSLKIISAVSSKTLSTKIVKLTSTELWLRYACNCYEVRFTKN